MDNAKLVMLDDDLSFAKRDGDGKHFHVCNEIELRAMFEKLDEVLDRYAHAGVCERFMSQHRPREFQLNTKYLNLLACNLALFPTPQPRARTLVCEDIDINLQLLTQGYQNILLTEWCQSNVPNASGGCSTYRTDEVRKESQEQLEKNFPGIVETLDRSEGSPRMNRISWSLAIKQGRRRFPRVIRFPRIQK